MSASAVVGRREFIRTGAAIGGGLLVSLHAPLAGRTSDAVAAVAESRGDTRVLVSRVAA